MNLKYAIKHERAMVNGVKAFVRGDLRRRGYWFGEAAKYYRIAVKTNGMLIPSWSGRWRS